MRGGGGGGFGPDSGIKRSLLLVTLTEEGGGRHFVPGTKGKTPGCEHTLV